jgi:hypothetical protein
MTDNIATMLCEEADRLDADQARDALVDNLFAVFRNEVAGHEMDPETAVRDGIHAILDHLAERGRLLPPGSPRRPTLR